MTSQRSPENAGNAGRPSVAIVGGGLAGLSAGCALAEEGFRVTLFERKPYLGGRASSYEHPGTGEVVDNCQHVLLGCCTNLLDLYRRLGVEQQIRWYDRLTFIEPGGRRGVLESSRCSAPLHTLPAFLRFPLLSAGDKLRIAFGLLPLLGSTPSDDGGSFLAWLQRHGQSRQALDRFWTPVLVSALNEELADVSVHYGAMVFRDAFLKSAQAGRMGLPTVPLSDLYGEAADYIRRRGGEVLLRTPVESLGADGQRAWTVLARAADGEGRRDFDYAISAVPFDAVGRLIAPAMQSDDFRERLAGLRSSPITGIHLWFDREVTELDHAVLLERTIQWMFQKSKILDRPAHGGEGNGSYLELVVSSSKTLLQKSRQEIVDLALKELAEFFPAVKEARLLKSTVVKEVNATFTPAPGSERYRPPQAFGWPRLLLSGDWTSTGWPSTMEGAVRAGYAAAEALTNSCGQPRRFLVPDLAPQGFMRLFKGD